MGENAELNGPAKKKRKLNENGKKNKPAPTELERLMVENPTRFLEENELFVCGMNTVERFLKQLRKFTNDQVLVFYDQNGADFIGCKWIMSANSKTQKTLSSALWELG